MQKESWIQRTVIKIGVLSLIIGYLCFIYLWFGAFFSPEKYIIVAVDIFGEGLPEAIALLLTLPCVIYFMMNFRDAITKSKKVEL